MMSVRGNLRRTLVGGNLGSTSVEKNGTDYGSRSSQEFRYTDLNWPYLICDTPSPLVRNFALFGLSTKNFLSQNIQL